jgi:hypothetical protein
MKTSGVKGLGMSRNIYRMLLLKSENSHFGISRRLKDDTEVDVRGYGWNWPRIV